MAVVLSICLQGGFSLSAISAELEQIGTFDFPTSASGEAQKHFTLGGDTYTVLAGSKLELNFAKLRKLILTLRSRIGENL